MPEMFPIAIRCSLYQLDDNCSLAPDDLPLWREAGFPVDAKKCRLSRGLHIAEIVTPGGWVYVLEGVRNL